MSFPINITYQGLAPSPSLSAHIHKAAAQLAHYAPRLQACRVTVRQSEQRHTKGNRYLVTVHATLPGAEFRAGRTNDTNQSHADAYVAASDAIDALRRQLEDFIRIQRERRQASG